MVIPYVKRTTKQSQTVPEREIMQWGLVQFIHLAQNKTIMLVIHGYMGTWVEWIEKQTVELRWNSLNVAMNLLYSWRLGNPAPA